MPPAHSSNWARYCGRYNACAQPVVFVQDRWVRGRYAQARYEYDHGRPYVQSRPGRDKDRDGDGVRNKHDRAPDNPYRR